MAKNPKLKDCLKDCIGSLCNTLYGMVRARGKFGVAGIWSDEHKMIEAARQTRAAGFKKFDAISPFPLHGIDEAIGLKMSWIPWVTFFMGLSGCLFGLWFTWWASAENWPLIVGGKPMWSLPAFIPVIFELTILFAALSSVGALIYICGMPKLNPPVIDPALSSHKFAIFVPEDDVGFDVEKVEKLFRDFGAEEVRQTEF